MLAKTRADVTPMNPKKGALAGQVSISTDMMYYWGWYWCLVVVDECLLEQRDEAKRDRATGGVIAVGSRESCV